MHIIRKILLTGILVCIGFVGGVIFQKYYTIDRLFRDIGLRNLSDYQKSGRSRLPISLLNGKKLMVALAFGQSNSANFGSVRHQSMPGVYNLFENELYAAQDPLIGASGTGGSVWTWLGDMLINSNLYDGVVFITIGVSGTEIEKWAPEGELHDRIIRAIKSTRKSRLDITHLLWHQGETDALIGTSSQQYQSYFRQMLASIRNHGITAPIFVSLASRCGETMPDAMIRGAQSELVDVTQNILPGPDTDKLGASFRYDDCHFSQSGLQAVATLWHEQLTMDDQN